MLNKSWRNVSRLNNHVSCCQDLSLYPSLSLSLPNQSGSFLISRGTVWLIVAGGGGKKAYPFSGPANNVAN